MDTRMHICRECSKIMQKFNYKTYLQDIRMAYAYRDLLNTDHTISQIALDNGNFAAAGAFSGEFQKRYGVLPSEMRKQINEKGLKKRYRLDKKTGEKYPLF